METLLAQDHVKAAIGKRQFGGAALMPFDLRVTPRDTQHTFVDVDASNRAELAADQTDTTGDQPGTTGNIQHPITISATACQNEVISPRLHDFKREAIIGYRRVANELPATHDFPPACNCLAARNSCTRLTTRLIASLICDTSSGRSIFRPISPPLRLTILARLDATAANVVCRFAWMSSEPAALATF
jgi:hypothetical protein